MSQKLNTSTLTASHWYIFGSPDAVAVVGFICYDMLLRNCHLVMVFTALYVVTNELTYVAFHSTLGKVGQFCYHLLQIPLMCLPAKNYGSIELCWRKLPQK